MKFVSFNQKTIISEFQLKNLNKQQQKRVLELITEVIQTKIFDMVLSSLSDDQKIEFLKLITKKKHKSARSYAKDKIKNLDKKLRTTIKSAKEDLLQEINAVRGIK